jgi:hypothetical protein
MYPLPGNSQAGTYIFPQIFRPFGQNVTFLPAYTLPYTYTIKESREMKLYHSPKDSYPGTYAHTYIHFYIDRFRNIKPSTFNMSRNLKKQISKLFKIITNDVDRGAEIPVDE